MIKKILTITLVLSFLFQSCDEDGSYVLSPENIYPGNGSGSGVGSGSGGGSGSGSGSGSGGGSGSGLNNLCEDETACNYNTNDTICLYFDCLNVCGGNTFYDSCGVCGGDNTACQDINCDNYNILQDIIGCSNEWQCIWEDGECRYIECEYFSQNQCNLATNCQWTNNECHEIIDNLGSGSKRKKDLRLKKNSVTFKNKLKNPEIF